MQPDQITVLVVDDEPDLREIFTAWLNMSGFTQVRTAMHGAEALSVLQAETIDVLISDIRMPVMDGITMVRRLTDLGIKIPTIMFVSGFGDIDMREMYGLGVQAFLSKPLDRDELIHRIEAAITDRSELWLTPFVPEPRQMIDIQVETSNHPQDGAKRMAIGQGGFSLTDSEPMSLSKTSFACHFKDASVEGTQQKTLSGHGYVRWYSKTDRMAGIELAYLDPSCHRWVCEEIARSQPRSFIPSGIDLQILESIV